MKALMNLGLRSMVAAAALCLLNPVAHAKDLLETVKSSGTLRVGLEGTYPPFGYRAKSGELDGFDVDVVKAIAAKLGVKTDYVTTEWSGIIGGLQAGKFDVIVNQVGITEARQKALDFSTPYAYSAAQLVQRKDDDRNFDTLGSLKGITVGAVLGTNYADFAKTIPGAEVKTYPGAAELMRDLAAKRVDVGLNDRLMLPYLLKTTPLPLRAGAIVQGMTLEVGIPFHKGNPEFAKAIDGALEAMRQDGTLKQISMKWFGSDTSQPAGK